MSRTTWADIEREENPPNEVKCGDCGREFTPTPENEEYCWKCLGAFYAAARSEYEYGGPSI